MTVRRVLAVALALTLPAVPASASASFLDLPVPAAAKLRSLLRERSGSTSHRSFAARFELGAGNGYRLVVVGEGDTVAVEVARPSSLDSSRSRGRADSQAVTLYAARGTVTPRRIAASFGKFGSIDVRFRPRGKADVLGAHRHCNGPDHITVQRGAFVGGIRFDGEDDYVSVHAHRAEGRVRSPSRLDCLPAHFRPAATQSRRRPVTGSSHGSSKRFLVAASRHGVKSTELYAIDGRRRLLTFVIVEEGLGRIAEFHFGFAGSRPKALAIDSALTRATLAPSAPFHGVGTYEAGPDGSKSWSGSLSVSFPGAPRRPLTGEQFRAAISAGF